MYRPNRLSYSCSDCEHAQKPDKPFDLAVYCELRQIPVHLTQRVCDRFIVSVERLQEYVRVIQDAIDSRVVRKNNA